VPAGGGLARVTAGARVRRARRGPARADPRRRGTVVLQAHPRDRRGRPAHVPAVLRAHGPRGSRLRTARRPAVTPEGDLELEGRVLPASNATFVGRIDGVHVVYKPVAGERPLWDFPGVVLAHREIAARLVSEATGWDV